MDLHFAVVEVRLLLRGNALPALGLRGLADEHHGQPGQDQHARASGHPPADLVHLQPVLAAHGRLDLLGSPQGEQAQQHDQEHRGARRAGPADPAA